MTILAHLSAAPAAGAPSDEITAVTAGTDIVSFAFPVVDGDVVRYVVGSGFTQIGGGLTADREYNVLVDVQNASIRLGSRFDPVSSVDPLRDVITFDAPHNFRNGDRVVYTPGAGLSIIKPGQVTSGQLLYVRLIQIDTVDGQPVYDAFRLRLTTSPTQATQTDDQLLSTLTSGQINSTTNTFTMGSAGQFTSGQAVTYIALGVKQFTGGLRRRHGDDERLRGVRLVRQPARSPIDHRRRHRRGPQPRLHELELSVGGAQRERRELLHPWPWLLHGRRRDLPQPRAGPTSAACPAAPCTA